MSNTPHNGDGFSAAHPLFIVVALPRMLSNVANDSTPVCSPAGTRQSARAAQYNVLQGTSPQDAPLVSKGPPGPVVQMIGRRPIAFEMARTRLSMSHQSTPVYQPCQTHKHTDITKRRTHGGGRDPEHRLDRVAGPTKLSNDLLVGHRSEGLPITSIVSQQSSVARLRHVRGATRCAQRFRGQPCTQR